MDLLAGLWSRQSIQITAAKASGSGAVACVWQPGHTVLGVLRR